MAGSGTILKMARLNKRNWLGNEVSKEYCDIIEERMKITPEEITIKA